MKKIENNKARISRKGNPFQKIESFISPFRGIEGVLLSPLPGGLRGALIMGALLLSSCLEVRENSLIPGPDPDSDPQMTLSVTIPGIETQLTRALSEANESDLQTVDILVFRENGSGQPETYLYRTHATDLSGTGSSRTFKTYLQESENNIRHRLVILANLREEIERAELSDPFTNTMTKEEVLSSITFLSDITWDTSSTDYRPLPMWGESPATHLVTTALTGDMIGTIPLLRSVVRVDVGINLNTSDQPQPLTENDLQISDIYLYYAMDKGRAAPGADHYDPSAGSTGEGAVVAPSIPDVATPLTLPLHQTTTTGHFLREIYLAEADNKEAVANGDEPVSLVVGGYFTKEGESPNTTEKSFYRIDFYDTSTTTPKLLDLLRNHRYRVNILKVSGAGLPTKELAIAQPPINIETKIEVSEEGIIKDMVYDGQYYLGVNSSEFELTSDSWLANETTERNLLIVTTTYPTGWSITGITDEQGTAITGWLQTSVQSGNTGTRTEVRLLLQENTTGVSRTGYIHLKAGKLEHKIKVEQTTQSRIWLRITDRSGNEFKDGDSLWFDAGITTTITAQTLQLEWEPKDKDIQITLQNGATPFNFGTGADQLTNGQLLSGGNKVLMIQPPAMEQSEYDNDPFLVKETKVTFTLAGTTEKKDIVIQQLKAGLIFEVKPNYLMDGGEHSFIVKSNTNWTASVTTNPNNVIELITQSGGNNTTGETVKFKTINDMINPSIYQSKAKITFTSPLFEPVEVEIDLRSAEFVNPSNCYILKPGGIGILIPVSRANDHTTNAIGASDGFTAELLWTDNSNRIADNSNIKLVTEAGSGSSGHILVLPGSGEGNAVVAVRSKVDNQIKWSWHIWVTNDDPVVDHTNGSYSFMDRNLGALTNTQNQQTSLGLLYQWGRKDPFPGASATTGSNEVPIYSASGATSIVKSSIGSGVTNNLSTSVQNPQVFYYNASTTYDWYTTNQSTQNDALWGSGSTKSIYDPCPDGWRVPWFNGSTSPWNGFSTSNFTWINNGRVYSGSYYPAAGCRYYTSGTLYGVGTYGYYWSASPNGVGGYGFHFHSSLVLPSNSTSRAFGYSVRCVQE